MVRLPAIPTSMEEGFMQGAPLSQGTSSAYHGEDLLGGN